MKKAIKITGMVVLALFVLIAGLAGFAYYKMNSIKDTHDLQVQADELCEKFMAKGKSVGLAVGVVKGDKTYINTYGYLDKTTKRKPDSLSLFEIGSITKVFTAEMAQVLVEQGQLNWEDNIWQYLPENALPVKQDGTTLMHLASHTSGFPRLPDDLIKHIKDMCNPYNDLNKNILHTYLHNCADKKLPGPEQYDYSNLGMGLLGHVMENKTGKDYNTLLQELICLPLGMQYTSLNLVDSTNCATGHDAKGKATCYWDFPVMAGCGAIRSNITDMVRFLKANIDGTTTLEKNLQKTHAQVTDIPMGGIGYGWHIDKANGALHGVWEIIWHNGGTGGFSTYMGFDKQSKAGVIVLANQSSEAVDRLGIDLMIKAAKVSMD